MQANRVQALAYIDEDEGPEVNVSPDILARGIRGIYGNAADACYVRVRCWNATPCHGRS